MNTDLAITVLHFANTTPNVLLLNYLQRSAARNLESAICGTLWYVRQDIAFRNCIVSGHQSVLLTYLQLSIKQNYHLVALFGGQNDQ